MGYAVMLDRLEELSYARCTLIAILAKLDIVDRDEMENFSGRSQWARFLAYG